VSPVIRDTGNIPQVSEGYHTLRIVSSQLVDGTAYNQPDVPETKLEMTFEVITPDEPRTTFRQQLSLNLGEKATLGNISRAALRLKDLPRGEFDTDELNGRTFDCKVGHSTGGWPKVINESASPSRSGRIHVEPQGDPVPWESDDEPPF